MREREPQEEGEEPGSLALKGYSVYLTEVSNTPGSPPDFLKAGVTHCFIPNLQHSAQNTADTNVS